MCALSDTGRHPCVKCADGLVQSLVVARMRLDRGESEQALADLDTLIGVAQRMATRHVDPTAH